jgi:molybdopterin converting factor small subunit
MIWIIAGSAALAHQERERSGAAQPQLTPSGSSSMPPTGAIERYELRRATLLVWPELLPSQDRLTSFAHRRKRHLDRRFDWQDANLKVRFYGKLADLFGHEREVRIATPCTVAELRLRLATEHPEAAESLLHKRVRTCIGDSIAQERDVVPEGTVPEFLAPLSGG